jgi:hypothetical protein
MIEWNSQAELIITTRKIQNKKHHKKRINKKWMKRYGYTYIEVQEKGKPIIVNDKGSLKMYLTLDDYNRLKMELKER